MKTSIDWRRRLALVLAALVASLGAVTVVAPAPAQAATSIRYCFPLWLKNDNGWWVMKMICIDVPYAYNPDWWPDYGIDLQTDVVLPVDVQDRYVTALTDGLNLVGLAQRTRDPRQAAALRGQAQQAFLTSAKILGKHTVVLKDVGTVDRAKLTFDPSPQPWLSRAGTDITDGIRLMQAAAGGPSPDPWLRAGMAEFEVAYDQLETPARG